MRSARNTALTNKNKHIEFDFSQVKMILHQFTVQVTLTKAEIQKQKAGGPPPSPLKARYSKHARKTSLKFNNSFCAKSSWRLRQPK